MNRARLAKLERAALARGHPADRITRAHLDTQHALTRAIEAVDALTPEQHDAAEAAITGRYPALERYADTVRTAAPPEAHRDDPAWARYHVPEPSAAVLSEARHALAQPEPIDAAERAAHLAVAYWAAFAVNIARSAPF